MGLCVSRTTLTAPSRKSGSYRRRVSGIASPYAIPPRKGGMPSPRDGPRCGGCERRSGRGFGGRLSAQRAVARAPRAARRWCPRPARLGSAAPAIRGGLRLIASRRGALDLPDEAADQDPSLRSTGTLVPQEDPLAGLGGGESRSGSVGPGGEAVLQAVPSCGTRSSFLFRTEGWPRWITAGCPDRHFGGTHIRGRV